MRWLGLGAALLALTACGPPEPLRIGFIGGLSGQISDLGEAGRDGALMAVEQVNAGGGVNGRKVELVVHDDAQQAEVAVKAMEKMAAARVEVVIGPMTSAMGAAVLPVARERGILLVSPTITARSLSAQDDPLLKVSPLIGDITRPIAQYLYKQGLRRVAIAFDLKNQVFSADWSDRFRRDFIALGGEVVAEVPFSSGDFSSYDQAIDRIVDARPDVLHFVASAVDAVRLMQMAHHHRLELPVSAASWAATENLIPLGGKLVDGMVLAQFFDRDDQTVLYQSFRESFRTRYRQDPGFAAVAAYDATRATLAALGKRQRGQSLKEVLLSAGPYQGLQEQWNFDRFGDAQRRTFVTVVRHGAFVQVE